MTANQNQPVKPVKRLTEGLVSSSLLVSNPSQTSMDLAKTPSNNIPGMFLNIAVGDIDFFDKNPRRQHDEELYAQIKASIRASGVQHPVHITRRPNESRYILAQGGIRALKSSKNSMRKPEIRALRAFLASISNTPMMKTSRLPI